MNESILTSIKKMLGPEEEYEHFDTDIITHINTTFVTLKQLGVGPAEGFYISDKSALWREFTQDIAEFIAAKTYVYLKVKLIFDPPTSSAVIEAMKQQIAELEWRLNSDAERLSEEVPNDE